MQVKRYWLFKKKNRKALKNYNLYFNVPNKYKKNDIQINNHGLFLKKL